jgi:hypothetical protein
MQRVVIGEAAGAKYKNGTWVHVSHPMAQWDGHVLGSKDAGEGAIEYEIGGAPAVARGRTMSWPLLVWENEIDPA